MVIYTWIEKTIYVEWMIMIKDRETHFLKNAGKPFNPMWHEQAHFPPYSNSTLAVTEHFTDKRRKCWANRYVAWFTSIQLQIKNVSKIELLWLQVASALP